MTIRFDIGPTSTRLTWDESPTEAEIDAALRSAMHQRLAVVRELAPHCTDPELTEAVTYACKRASLALTRGDLRALHGLALSLIDRLSHRSTTHPNPNPPVQEVAQ